MRTEPARQILMPVKETPDFFVRHYNMNLYCGCCHGCIYCDARSICYQLKQFDQVRVKENALELMREELKRKRVGGVVGMGGMSDAYNPFEEKQLVTRGALKLLAEYGFGVGITTKSALVARDADVMKTIAQYAPAHVSFSITAADDALSRLMEPNVCASGQRFQAMGQLTDAGVLTGMWLNPVLPFITDHWENLRALLHLTRQVGGRYALCHFGVTLRDGNREYFYAALDKVFPGVKMKYVQAFGNSYICQSPDAKRLYGLYAAECEALGLAYQMCDINALIRSSGGASQMSLF